jgi:hypothetical protein
MKYWIVDIYTTTGRKKQYTALSQRRITKILKRNFKALRANVKLNYK